MGKKAFSAYLSDNPDDWAKYDPSLLMQKATQFVPAKVDHGEGDEFLVTQLNPESLEAAAKLSGYPLSLNRYKDYDHSYYFIASFIEQHLRFHAEHLNA